MNTATVHCPACGSNDIERSEKESFGQITLGSIFPYKEIFYLCNSCHEEGDFLLETDENYLNAQKNAQAIFVKDSIEKMSAHGVGMAMLERVFELPTRTLTRWKNGDFSSAGLALLRLLETYPWLIDVAEHRFDRDYSQTKMIHVAVDTINAMKNNPTLNYQNPQMANRESPKFISANNYSMEA